MFGFGRQKAIEEKAKSLGDLMVLLVGCIGSMSVEELVEANRRRGFVESYDETDRLTKDRNYGFFEGEPEKVDFSFHVTYRDTGERTLTVEGHRSYFGLVLSGFADRKDIGVDIKEALHVSELGRDARALQTALLRFPGFHSMEQLYKKLGLN